MLVHCPKEARPCKTRLRPHDQRRRLVPFTDEVVETKAHRLRNIRADARNVGEALGARPDEDAGQPKTIEIVKAVRNRIDDGAIDPRTAKGLQMRRLSLGVPVGGKDQERGSSPCSAILRATGDIGPERIGDVGDHQPQHATATGTHAHG